MAENLEKIHAFFAQTDEDGLTNLEKARRDQKILRRAETTDKNRSVEAVDADKAADGLPRGVVIEDGKLIGLGIHIFNEDVYPLKSFEIYLRSCGLTGSLDLSGCADMVFLDLYHNRIEAVETRGLTSMRIFGVQDNRLTKLDAAQMPVCQGIDAGKNMLTELDVSRNGELVELYINDNRFTVIDLRGNPKLKYFYCHNNAITLLDTRANPLLRHLNATNNPMREIRTLAPQREERLPLELYAGEGGTVGLQFCPVYNAQWKETGEWRQTYYAYPAERHVFAGWYDAEGSLLCADAEWTDTYGASRVLTARFL